MASERRSTSAATAKPIDAKTRFLILHGKDRFLQDEYMRVLREALCAKHGKDGVDTVRFDGLQGAKVLADVLDECRSMGLMQAYKIVVVDSAEQMVKADDDEGSGPPAVKGKRRGPVAKSPREVLELYAEAPSENATLVLRAGTWRAGNLDKAVERVGAVIKCEPPTPEAAVGWAQKRAKARHESSIDPAAARMLIDSIGTDLGRIDTELEKLAVAAGGKGEPITSELVAGMVGMSREEEFWAIQTALLTGRASDALTQLRDLVEVSRHDPVPIGFSCVEMARKVHVAARGLAEGVGPARIIPALKAWGPGSQEIVSGVMSTAKALGPGAAADLLKDALNLDAANKSGLGEPVRNVERLCVRFAEAAGGRGSR